MVNNTMLLALLLSSIIEPRANDNHVSLLMIFIFVVKGISANKGLEEIIDDFKALDTRNDFEKLQEIIRMMYYAYQSWDELGDDIAFL